MKNQISKQDGVSVCNDSGCIHASGVYAEKIAAAIVVMLLLIGLGTILKSIK